MTLAEQLLPKLGEWRPVAAGRHSLVATFPQGWSVRLTADKADELACLVWEFALTRSGDAPANFTLNNWAEGVAKRATGLLEPLRVLEVDDARGEALLRSDAPSKRGEQVAYYEVRLFTAGRAELKRYAASRTTSGRDQVAFALTHEVLTKLAGDVAGC